MFERINGFSLSRFTAAAVLLATLAGCNRTEPSIYGFVDVVPSGVRETACEAAPSGELRLDGIQAGDVVTISAGELCHNWIVRKELPAGLYTASWQASGDEGDAHGVLGARWEARDPVIVNVFPEQTTTLRVYRVEPDPDLLCQASMGEAAERLPRSERYGPRCGDAPGAPGARRSSEDEPARQPFTAGAPEPFGFGSLRGGAAARGL